MRYKVTEDECGHLDVPAINDPELHDGIFKILSNHHFLHSHWEGYKFYRADAAAYICDFVEQMGYSKEPVVQIFKTKKNQKRLSKIIEALRKKVAEDEGLPKNEIDEVVLQMLEEHIRD